MKPRSNSIGLLVGAILAVGVIVTAGRLEHDGSQRLLWRSAIIGFAFVPLCIALAELRSGYSWKNLAPGNRGVARVDKPRTFWFSVAGHTAFAFGLLAFGLLATPPETPNHSAAANPAGTSQLQFTHSVSRVAELSR
jgi:hypothetical protein